MKVLHMNNMPKLVNISKGAMSKLWNLEELYCFDNIELVHIDKAALSSRRDDAEYETWPPLKKVPSLIQYHLSFSLAFLAVPAKQQTDVDRHASDPELEGPERS
jgi:hypothetical protein